MTKQQQKRMRRKNPEYKTAKEMAEEFHGRAVERVIDVEELEREPSNYAVIGDLEELEIVPFPGKTDHCYPMNWERQNAEDPESIVHVCCDAEGTQIYFIGGDQDITEFLGSIEGTKYTHEQKMIVVGFCKSVTYFTDKHHLEGDEAQKKGVPYQHEFGENGGEWPILVFDRENSKLLLAGGTYEVRDVGIYD